MEVGTYTKLKEEIPKEQKEKKKNVTFADGNGKELCTVLKFRYNEKTRTSFQELKQVIPDTRANKAKYKFFGNSNPFTFCFQSQEAQEKDILESHVIERYIAVESVVISKQGITGMGIVRNIGEQLPKSVTIIYTWDKWRTSATCEATFCRNKERGQIDEFIFTILSPTEDELTVKGPLVLELSARYRVGESEYWDDNNSEHHKLVIPRE